MLGSCICPGARLLELPPYESGGPPLAVAALGRAGATRSDFLAGLDADLRDIAACRGRLVVDVIETKLPVVAGETAREFPFLVRNRVDGLTPPPALYLEFPMGPNWEEALT